MTHGAKNSPKDAPELSSALKLAGLPADSETVLNASRMATFLVCIVFVSASAVCVFVVGLEESLLLVLMTILIPLLIGELIKGYPRVLSRRLASEVVKDSTGAISLMVMSLRREASLSRAIAFSYGRKDSFSAELKTCTWGVIMGRFASFEDALQNLGERWSGSCGELKTAMNALITASCEATEDGRRRALDRANNASVLGVKRRIEEYALSLSTPSMVMFGLAILLPLMVGSFLPMLSWDVWGASSGALGPNIGSSPIGLLQVVFIMNVLFPAIGLLVAMASITRHPLESRNAPPADAPKAKWMLAITPVCTTGILVSIAVLWLEGIREAAAVLISSTIPISGLLLYLGMRGANSARGDREASEEALFRTGARMVEGVNFESALCEACKEQEGALKSYIECTLLGSANDTPDSRSNAKAHRGADAQALEAFNVVKEAASKDERAAGLLAMDLATYIRELRETERSLRSRLKPTIAMMKITSFVLAPVVLGVTFAMYMTLGAIAGSGPGSLSPGMFFLVLGAFLAESNAVVQYFIWGIEGTDSRALLAVSLGSCVLVSELLYVATALIAG
ncbi:MAG: hypothetical protein A3K60_03385 [Euryarchaeota archaeon RBG_19FT_COMBO_56_21]|nr:MAG: hypothetical protein A3K60_03385 [Euryarchaeota archaeon RBG_19FT_COMBO_56_21]